MSVQVKRRREAATFLSTYVGATGELLVDTTHNRVIVQDGVTPGGFPAAKLSEVVALGSMTTLASSPQGANVQCGVLEELIDLSGEVVTSTIQIPSRAIVLAISARTVTSIVGAPSYSVGTVGGSSKQFGASLGTSAGATNSGVITPTAFYSPTGLSITATSGVFSGGSVRLTVHYLMCGPSTS
jgi:hypothetical protein